MPGASGHRKFFRSFFSYSTCEGTRESSKIPSLHLLFFDLWARVITSALNVFLLPRSSFFFFLSRNNKSTLFSDTLKSGKLRKREGEILILFLPNGYSPTPRYDAQLSPAMSAILRCVRMFKDVSTAGRSLGDLSSTGTRHWLRRTHAAIPWELICVASFCSRWRTIASRCESACLFYIGRSPEVNSLMLPGSVLG